MVNTAPSERHDVERGRPAAVDSDELARRTDEAPGPEGPCHRGATTMSEYLILIYDSESAGTPEDRGRLMTGHQQVAERHGAALRGGNALQPTSTAPSVRPDGAGGFTVTDAPFAETKEALGGYYLIEAADLDEAIAIAKQCPARFGGIEVRPIMVFS